MAENSMQHKTWEKEKIQLKAMKFIELRENIIMALNQTVKLKERLLSEENMKQEAKKEQCRQLLTVLGDKNNIVTLAKLKHIHDFITTELNPNHTNPFYDGLPAAFTQFANLISQAMNLSPPEMISFIVATNQAANGTLEKIDMPRKKQKKALPATTDNIISEERQTNWLTPMLTLLSLISLVGVISLLLANGGNISPLTIGLGISSITAGISAYRTRPMPKKEVTLSDPDYFILTQPASIAKKFRAEQKLTPSPSPTTTHSQPLFTQPSTARSVDQDDPTHLKTRKTNKTNNNVI